MNELAGTGIRTHDLPICAILPGLAEVLIQMTKSIRICQFFPNSNPRCVLFFERRTDYVDDDDDDDDDGDNDDNNDDNVVGFELTLIRFKKSDFL